MICPQLSQVHERRDNLCKKGDTVKGNADAGMYSTATEDDKEEDAGPEETVGRLDYY